MNPTITKMTQHVSVRNFKDQPLSEETKNQLLIAAQSGSSSNFVQAYSIIEITDLAIRNELATLSNSASYVKQTGTFYVFVADLYRQATILERHQQSLKGIQNMEALLVATVDTTIAAENMAIAAEALDLGICFIGGIRNNLARVAQLLKLPQYTVPLFGLTIGVPKEKNQVKPRLPLANKVSQNTYDSKQFTDLKGYDQITKNYYGHRANNQQEATWTRKNSDFFHEPRRPDVADFLRSQGFTLN